MDEWCVCGALHNALDANEVIQSKWQTMLRFIHTEVTRFVEGNQLVVVGGCDSMSDSVAEDITISMTLKYREKWYFS